MGANAPGVRVSARFASERLGRRLQLLTYSGDDQPGLELIVDWETFKPGRELSDVMVTVSEVPLVRAEHPRALKGCAIVGPMRSWSAAF